MTSMVQRSPIRSSVLATGHRELMGYSKCPATSTQSACYEANYAALAELKRARFAISTYPHLVDSIKRVASIPPDWFTRAADLGGERIIIAETGWNTESVVASLGGTCTTALSSTEAEARDYLDLLASTAERHTTELVTWWSNRDLLVAPAMGDCPCGFDSSW
jgi:hypothetical protein